MSIISIRDVRVGNPVARWSDAFKFTVTFECISHLPEDLEWKLIYVGSSSSVNFDQELDSCLVGPVPVGVNSFTFEADPPSVDKIPKEEILGVTVLLLTASYRDQEFVRVGYYVHNEYDTEELRENPPQEIDFSHLNRSILVEKPRVTRVAIDWGTETKGTVANGSQLPPVPAPATFEELNDVALQPDQAADKKEDKPEDTKASPKKETPIDKENQSTQVEA